MKTLHTDLEKEHADPLTGEPGAHPLGTGIGAAVGGAALGIVGATTGPVGVAVGIAVGAVLGGLSGKGFAEGYDPTVEDAYWREQHVNQPYAQEGDYEDFAHAYRTGHSGYREGKTFEEAEDDLRMEYEGGPQRPVAEHAAEAAEAGEDSLPKNLATHPLVKEEGRPVAVPPKPARSLEWYSARAAARAAYQRMKETEDARKNSGSRMD